MAATTMPREVAFVPHGSAPNYLGSNLVTVYLAERIIPLLQKKLISGPLVDRLFHYAFHSCHRLGAFEREVRWS